jgi:hypothetical protein
MQGPDLEIRRGLPQVEPTTPAQFNLCQETLQHAPDSAPATVYAIVAANQSYEATIAEGVSELPSSSGDVLAALRLRDRGGARAHGERDQRHVRVRLPEHMAGVHRCRGRREGLLRPAGQVPAPGVLAMNAADRDITTVARALGALWPSLALAPGILARSVSCSSSSNPTGLEIKHFVYPGQANY